MLDKLILTVQEWLDPEISELNALPQNIHEADILIDRFWHLQQWNFVSFIMAQNCLGWIKIPALKCDQLSIEGLKHLTLNWFIYKFLICNMRSKGTSYQMTAIVICNRVVVIIEQHKDLICAVCFVWSPTFRGTAKLLWTWTAGFVFLFGEEGIASCLAPRLNISLLRMTLQ